jgi:hypothetical protein
VETIQLPWERGVRMLNRAGLAAPRMPFGTRNPTALSGANSSSLFFYFASSTPGLGTKSQEKEARGRLQPPSPVYLLTATTSQKQHNNNTARPLRSPPSPLYSALSLSLHFLLIFFEFFLFEG